MVEDLRREVAILEAEVFVREVSDDPEDERVRRSFWVGYLLASGRWTPQAEHLTPEELRLALEAYAAAGEAEEET